MASYKNYEKNHAGRNQPSSSNARKAKLGRDEMKNRVKDWITFYRKNPARFAQHYLGLKLYWFQSLILHMMDYRQEFLFIGTRGIGKSFVIAVYACIRAILYPNSKIVIVSLTKRQSSLIILAKIQKELCSLSPTLANEIKKISTNNGEAVCTFWNGSTITAVPCSDSSRGLRASAVVGDEMRLLNPDTWGSVIQPMLEIRQTPFSKKAKYKDLPVEEPKEVFLSSAYYKTNWMWTYIKDTTKKKWLFTKKQVSTIFAMDYSSVIKYKLKTLNQVKKAKKDLGKLVFDMEFGNLMIGFSENAFYSFDQLSPTQTLTKAFYPKYNVRTSQKNKAFKYLPKKEGEYRIVSVDLAMLNSITKDNDASVITCTRALPTGNIYKRKVVSLESYEGMLTDKQALRIKQVFYQFEADICVVDCGGNGIGVYDSLAQVTYDPDSDKEYPAWHSFNNEDHRMRINVPASEGVIFSILGTAKLNDAMHRGIERSLEAGKIELLLSQDLAKDELSNLSKEYKDDKMSPVDRAHLEMPFLETDFLIQEMVSLSAETNKTSNTLKLTEPRSGRKDRYMSFGYGQYYIDLLELELINESANSSDDDDLVYY